MATRADILRRAAERDAGDADARHHRLARRAVAEGEQLAQHLAGLGAELAAFLALVDDERELFGRIVVVARAFASG